MEELVLGILVYIMVAGNLEILATVVDMLVQMVLVLQIGILLMVLVELRVQVMHLVKVSLIVQTELEVASMAV